MATSRYINALGGKVHVYDPYKIKVNKNYKKHSNIKLFLKQIDVLSIHIHYTLENHKFINKKLLSYMKKNILIVNTSRGEVVNESDLLIFLKKNKDAKYSTDVLSAEINFKSNILFKYSLKYKNKLFITPHVGGMTYDARKIAYNKATDDLIRYFK